MTTAKVHTFMCSDPGQAMIAEDIQKERLNRVVVASCSPFLHELTFRTAVQRGGLNPYLYEHVNIREQDSWAHKHDPAGATAKALRMIAAAVGKLRHAEPLERIRITNHRQALVIGGGIAGLKAAAELAGKGIPVILVEQSPSLGGRVASLAKTYPREIEAAELVKASRRASARPSSGPNFYPCASWRRFRDLSAISMSGLRSSRKRMPQDFAGGIRVAAPAHEEEISASVGAVILATGFDPYTPGQGRIRVCRDRRWSRCRISCAIWLHYPMAN